MGAPQSIEIDIKTLNPSPVRVQKCSGARWNGLRSSNPDFPDRQLALGFWSNCLSVTKLTAPVQDLPEGRRTWLYAESRGLPMVPTA